MIWSGGGSGENEVGHKRKKLSFFSLCFCDSLVNSVGLHFLANKFVVLWEVISYRQYSRVLGCQRTCILAVFPFLMPVGKGELCFMKVWFSAFCKAISHPPVLFKGEYSWWNKSMLLALCCSGKQPWSVLSSLGTRASLWFCFCPPLQCSSLSPLISLRTFHPCSLMPFLGNPWVPGLPCYACCSSSRAADSRGRGAVGALAGSEVSPFPCWAPRGAHNCPHACVQMRQQGKLGGLQWWFPALPHPTAPRLPSYRLLQGTGQGRRGTIFSPQTAWAEVDDNNFMLIIFCL